MPRQGLELVAISAVSGEGIEQLKYAIANKVEELRRAANLETATPVANS